MAEVAVAGMDMSSVPAPAVEITFEPSSDTEAQEPLIETSRKTQEPTLSRSYCRTGLLAAGLVLGLAAIWKCSGRTLLSSASRRDVISQAQATGPVINYVPVRENYEDFPVVETTEPYMRLTEVVENNLGGYGPTDGPKEIRYYGVFTTTAGDVIDLVLTAVTKYKPKNQDNNGLSGKLGQISVRGGKSTDFLFKLVETGTYNIVKVKNFYFTIYDIDRPEKADNPMSEMVSLAGFEHAALAGNTSVRITPWNAGHPPQFWGTAGDSTGDTNPTDPFALTQDQLSRSVSFDFPSAGEIKVTMATPGGKKGEGRNFLFSGVPAFDCLNGTSSNLVSSDLTFTETVYSNLGGQGPDFDSPQGMRFKKIYTFPDGTAADLIVKDLHGYKEAKPDLNGVRDSFGCINMKTPTRANFSFEFVDSVTSERVTIKNLKFSFLDMDGFDKDLGFNERIIMGGFKEVYVTENTEVKIEPRPNGLTRFSSTKPDTCGGCRNPTDPLALTPDQQARAFTVLMPEASRFTLIIDISNTKKKMARSIYFAGSTNFAGGGEEIELCPCPCEEE